MEKLPYKQYKKLLIGLTIVEIVSLIITIITVVATFDYTLEVALGEFTNPWLGSNTEMLELKYNVPLMVALSNIGAVSTILWFLANIIRFIFIKGKYKLFALGGFAFLGVAFFLIGHAYIEIICLILGIILLGYSHKIDKEEIKQ